MRTSRSWIQKEAHGGVGYDAPGLSRLETCTGGLTRLVHITDILHLLGPNACERDSIRTAHHRLLLAIDMYSLNVSQSRITLLRV